MKKTRQRAALPRNSYSSNIKQGSPADVIINQKFGGLGAFCGLSGIPTSTVWGWLIRGLIPTRQQRLVLDLARKAKVHVEAEDFIG